MPNIASVLKDEIIRLARREVRTETENLKTASSAIRAQISQMERELHSLRRELIEHSNGREQVSLEVGAPPVQDLKVRFSPTKLKGHRERLELSATQFGRLFGVTGQTIYNWEAGTRPAKDHLVKIAQLRKLTRRQAHALLGKQF